jgi:glutamate-ammonia-ligase adenylyltransferase
MCDILGLHDLQTVTRQLSDLADALIKTCLGIAANLSNKSADHFAVIALGKLGGQELNYSSDIDLLFLARATTSEHLRLGERLIDSLARVTAEGFLYRVDMRLRPWGKDGSLVSSLGSHLAYLTRSAQVWEKQALLKARFVAGDEQVGEEFLRQSMPLLFTSTYEAVRQDVHAMKQRTEAFLRQKGRSWGEVKLGEGSIRDVEFVAQFLQLGHGAEQPGILTPNTLLALDRLRDSGFFQAEEQRALKDGYIFFRTMEHYLQMMDYQQTYTLPADPQALSLLAQRLGFLGAQARELLIARYEQHRSAVRGIYLRMMGNERMEPARSKPASAGVPDLAKHLTRMDPSYAAAFSEGEIQRHAALAGRLTGDHLVEVEAEPLAEAARTGSPGNEAVWRVTIVAFDYPGELSLICGLLFVYHLNIDSGLVFTYEPLNGSKPASQGADARRVIVDVFAVRYMNGAFPPDLWQRYAGDLEQLLRQTQAGERREARSQLAKRVATRLGETASTAAPLYPIGVGIDNDISEKYSVLRIDSQDTAGFLYELTNALAFHRVYISQVKVESHGSRIFDTLYVTDASGRKITDPARQRELRAAIVLIKHFTHLLPYSANPETALLHFRAFIEKLFQQPGWPDEVTSLERPEVLQALAQVLGVSDFLWEDFLRMQYENLFPVVRDIDELAVLKTKGGLRRELEAALAQPTDQIQDPIYGAGWRAALNAFKDRELFRVDMRNILGYTEVFEQFSHELTDLAEVIVEAFDRLGREELIQQFGEPLQEGGGACPIAICALGKCGGRELGFASDIELMFVYSGKGRTAGPKVITVSEFYEKLVELVMGAVRGRREGIFQIDLQLRPYGKAGSLAVSLAAFKNYFHPQGPAWAYERQALVKLRAIAGDVELGREIEALRDGFVYTGEPFDATAMRAMRERQVRHMVAGGTFNAKYSPGGLLDVEYLVQGLQITHGAEDPGLRQTNTRAALAALAEHGILSHEAYARLRKAHTFLRWLIDTLRVVRGNAKDLTVPPFGSEEYEYLTRRLRYGNDTQRLRDELIRFTNDVLELNRKLLP